MDMLTNNIVSFRCPVCGMRVECDAEEWERRRREAEEGKMGELTCGRHESLTILDTLVILDLLVGKGINGQKKVVITL